MSEFPGFSRLRDPGPRPATAALRGPHDRPWHGKTSTVPVDRSAPEASSLDRVALEMTSTLELDAVLASVTRGLVEDLGVALARVWLVEPGDAAMTLRASSGLSSRLDGTYGRVPMGARKIGRIAETRQAMWTNDVLHDERIADADWARDNGLVSFAGWPLTFHDALEGVLATFSCHPLSEAVLGRMALFAHQAAIAIKNARLFAAVRALERRLEAENDYLRREVAGGDDDALSLLSRCDGLAPLLEQVRKVAPTSTTVLLHGETGTGKELIARAVHELSPRRAGPLVRVNCAALSPTLVESELFGHERGAFTGAQQRRVGRFELADGGTLLLDEVGEIPPEMQPKLLRVLQEQEFERVGGSQAVRVNVRIVSATNRDLAKAVDAGRFRADLFYRLAVFPIEVPPLRARPGDCAVLARAFVNAQAHRLGKALDGLEPGALDRLLAHDWPGNVRELANVIERAAIVASRATITERDLPPLARADAPPASARPADGAAGAEEDADPRLESVERAHVTRVLDRVGWVIEGKKGAAAVLGLAPSTLRSRMAQLAIRRQSR
jgi:transcriptional regulator with GAF, ATPase, and Fis domain